MVLLKSESAVLKHGDKAPDFLLKGTDGKTYSLSNLKPGKAFLIMFMCNHCPYVQAKFEALNAIWKDFKDAGLIMVGINPNDPVEYPEDSMVEMKKFVAQGKVTYLYLQDESQVVAKKYGAVCTPDPFLFNSKIELVYHGRIDNANSPGKKPSTQDLRDAIQLILSSKPLSGKEMPSMGCSIKWRE